MLSQNRVKQYKWRACRLSPYGVYDIYYDTCRTKFLPSLAGRVIPSERRGAERQESRAGGSYDVACLPAELGRGAPGTVMAMAVGDVVRVTEAQESGDPSS
jgi:hypothetical protein